jgi:adenine-specific DNA-methyltransferase
VEQMDYAEAFIVERLKKVIAGEQGGISKDVGWQGGGDFVYCELLQWNERFVRRIEAATSAADLQALWEEMQTQAFLSYRVDVAAVNANAGAFADFALDEQKRFLLETLDYNALYANLSEIDDADYAVSAEDRRLNAQFYGKLD